MKSIPSRLLKDSCLLKTEISRDEWGKPVYSEARLENVCIRAGVLGEESSLSAENVPFGVLYFDAERSRPVGAEFVPLKQVVTFGGESFRVLSCERFCCEGRLHHMKVRLGRK